MSSHGIQFKISEDLCLRDPQDTTYGKKVIRDSILLFDELGFESFTFKKLAIRIDSTEASIYRYFENKHFLLLWLTCWYWEWVNYLIDINLRNITDPEVRLRVVIHHIVNASTESPLTDYVNENTLHRVVIKEGSKAYHVRSVDRENKMGYFESYEELVSKVASIIREVSPKFPYRRMLASNLFEMANNQIYFAEHMPQLTDIKNNGKKYQRLEEAIYMMVHKVLH